MTNSTVKDLIEILLKLDQEAVVCHAEFEDYEPIFSTFEICRYFENVTYIDDSGQEVVGNVVALF
jgi:hypothetical protein